MGALTLRDNLYKCTQSSMWVCMIEGRFLVSKQGKVGFKCKRDAALAFKNSEYWEYIVGDLKVFHKDKSSASAISGRYWNSNKVGKEIEDKKYKELLEQGIVKYYEINQVPGWVNL